MPAWLAHLDVISTEFIVTAWVVVAVVAAGVVVSLGRRWRRRPPDRHWPAISLSAFVVVLVALVATSASVNAYYAFLPTVDDVVQAATGDQQWVHADRLDRLSVSAVSHARRDGLVVQQPLPADRSDGFGSTTNIVYLPPQYFTSPATTFPVLYLFHGSPGRPQDWFHAGRAEQTAFSMARAGHPVIVVAPQMSRSWTDDPECVDGDHEKVETQLFDRVIPLVDSRFRTQTDRDGRIFAGMSAGGYCALNLGLRHRDAVATIIDLSGDTRPTHTGGASVLFGRGNAQTAALINANNPADYAGTLTDNPPMRIWLDTGSADHDIIKQMAPLAATLRARGIDTVWQVRPGGHTYWVWTKALRESLPWALTGIAGSVRPPSKPGPSS